MITQQEIDARNAREAEEAKRLLIEFGLLGNELLIDDDQRLQTAHEWALEYADMGLGVDEWLFENVTAKIKSGDYVVTDVTTSDHVYGDWTFKTAKPSIEHAKELNELEWTSRLTALQKLGEKHRRTGKDQSKREVNV